MSHPHYLEDFKVGQRFETGSHTLDLDQIRRFASEFDPQPFHLDEEAAKASFFKGIAASGWHVAAVTMRLLVTSGAISSGVGAGTEINWKMPVRPGDTLHARAEITDVRPSKSRPDRGMVWLRCETLNQHGDIVQVLETKFVSFRRPDAA